jgi:acylglycerol lipase
MDMRGHGYSDGMRALMPSLDETLADMEDFISYIMTGAKYTSAHCDLDNKVVEVIRELPFFIMASSGGAAFSTLLSIRMNEDVNFKGMVMLAPALSVDIPHWVLVIVLRYSIAYLAPEQDMPKCISNATDESLNYKDANVSAKMLEFEDTLSYTGKMRWATAMMFVDVMQRFNAQVSMVRKPFTIFHDPGDGICNISGSRQLLNESSTVWNRKSIVELPGEKHALLVNCTDRISELSSDWMDKQLKLW